MIAMIVKINAPLCRSLNANEKLVYDMLCKGLKSKEIAEIIRIPLSPPRAVENYNYWCTHDTDSISVMDIICSIRSKGYEIEEEDEMAKGYPMSQETKDRIIELYNEGVDKAHIIMQTGVSLTSVKRIIAGTHYTQKIPAAVATVAGKKQSDINIISQPQGYCNSLVKEIIEKELAERAEELATQQREINRIVEYLDYIKDKYDYMMAEYEMLQEAIK